MILRRLGNKSKIAKEIQKHFPPHKIYIEPFFGAGGMFFNKPKAKYNIVNDLDSDVFNLFQVVSNQKTELEEMLYTMPLHTDLLEFWKENNETEPIKKALRFLFLSNLTFLGIGTNLKFGTNRNDKKLLYENLLMFTNKTLFDVQFMNKDFRVFFNSIEFDDRGTSGTAESFIYADPPYLNTNNNYSNSFTKDDSIDLFNSLQETGCKWAMSEFDNEFILNQAKERNLNVYIIGERQNMKNRKTEILITNYKTSQISLF